MNKFKKIITAIIFAAAITVTGLSSTVSAVNVGYDDGSFYSKKTTGCTCHYAGHNPCSYDKSCDCKLYAGSIQCMAFAKYCHHIYNGTNESAMVGIKGDGNSVALTENNLHNYLLRAGKQSYLRGNGHSIFVVSFDYNTIEFYDANYDGKCRVHHLTYSYSAFANRLKYLDFALNSSGKIVEF